MSHTKSCVRLAQLLDIFIANEHGQLVGPNNKPMPFAEGPIARAVHAAQGRIADFKSIHDLANYVAMSRSNFYRLFKQARNEPQGIPSPRAQTTRDGIAADHFKQHRRDRRRGRI